MTIENVDLKPVDWDKPATVAAKQILVHRDYLFLIDAAGQLWVTDIELLDPPSWTQIELPQL